jgi:hypothetical protein
VTAPPRPWPFEELFAYAAASVGRRPHRAEGCMSCFSGQDPDVTGCLSQGHLAAHLGVTRRTVQRWARRGLTDDQADRAAVALGTVPGCVWPSW